MNSGRIYWHRREHCFRIIECHAYQCIRASVTKWAATGSRECLHATLARKRESLSGCRVCGQGYLATAATGNMIKKRCQEWDLNPRSFEPAPEAGALDRSAILTRFSRQVHAVILLAIPEFLRDYIIVCKVDTYLTSILSYVVRLCNSMHRIFVVLNHSTQGPDVLSGITLG